MRKSKNIVFLFVISIIIQSCTQVQDGSVWKCKKCEKIIDEKKSTITVPFWDKDKYKIHEYHNSYCDKCGNEKVPYLITYRCDICGTNYKTQKAEALRSQEIKDTIMFGRCKGICSKVTIEDLVSLYNDFAGEGLDKGKYTEVQAKEMWLKKAQNKYAVGLGTVEDVAKSVSSKVTEIFTDGLVDIDDTHIILKLSDSHYANLFLLPSEKSKLKAINKGDKIKFVGRLKSLGTGILFKHDIDNCKIISIN